MERVTFRVHDLLELSPSACARIAADAPAWVRDALERAPFAVVRRERSHGALVAVGIRGAERSERYAACVARAEIERAIAPEALATAIPPRDHAVFETMRRLAHLAEQLDLAWGPAGAAGFELATGVPVLHGASDLDAVVRAFPHDERLPSFAAHLRTLRARVDVELCFGDDYGVALEEALRERVVLVKTPDGPRTIALEAVR